MKSLFGQRDRGNWAVQWHTLLAATLSIFLLSCVVDYAACGRVWVLSSDSQLLHWLRGTREAPAKVLTATFDQQTLFELGLDADSSGNLDQHLHAVLLHRLRAAQAKTVSYDVFFEDIAEHPQQVAFGEAIRKHGSVILFGAMKHYPWAESLAMRGNPHPFDVRLESIEPPAATLMAASRGVAPFPLPQQDTLFQAWWIKESAGDVATLPLATFLIYADGALQTLLGEWVGLQHMTRGKSSELMSRYQTDLMQFSREFLSWMSFQEQPSVQKVTRRLQRRCEEQVQVACRALQLHRIYAGDKTGLINFYGAPRTVTSVSVKTLLQPVSLWSSELRQQVRDSAVFVGYSERFASAQKDSFESVYSSPDGLNISGVEVAATMFANLLHNDILRLPNFSTKLSIFAWLSLSGALLFLPSLLLALALSWTMLTLYALTAVYAFTQWQLLLPMSLLLGGVYPLVFLVALLWRLYYAKFQGDNISKTLSLYLPETVAQGVKSQRGDVSALVALKSYRQEVKAAVVMTDIVSYTSLTERLDNRALASFMDQYYSAMFEVVDQHGGQILDAVGDSLFALFIHEDESQAKLNALLAVSNMSRLQFEQGGQYVETRFGVDFGDALMVNLGTSRKVEFRVVGDVVNTASRMDGLNKMLRTKVLVSAAAKPACADGFSWRYVGNYLLAGKSQPTAVFEMLGQCDLKANSISADVQRFNIARELFDEQRWLESKEAFFDYLEFNSNDGPALFYIDQCEQRMGMSNEARWPGYFISHNK